MLFIRQHLISICVVLFLISLLFKTNRDSIKTESIIQQKNTEITNLTQKYEKEIATYKSQLQSIQNNNIVKTVVVYKTNGERIETKIVDRTVKKSNEIVSAVDNKQSLSKNLINTKIYENNKIDITEPTQYHYLVGLMNLQSNSPNLADHPLLIGVKIPYTSIYTFLTVPLTNNFYKNTTLNLAINF